MEQNVQVQETERATKKWSKGKKIAVWSGIGVAVAGIATAAVVLIGKFKKA